MGHGLGISDLRKSCHFIELVVIQLLGVTAYLYMYISNTIIVSPVGIVYTSFTAILLDSLAFDSQEEITDHLSILVLHISK